MAASDKAREASCCVLCIIQKHMKMAFFAAAEREVYGCFRSIGDREITWLLCGRSM